MLDEEKVYEFTNNTIHSFSEDVKTIDSIKRSQNYANYQTSY